MIRISSSCRQSLSAVGHGGRAAFRLGRKMRGFGLWLLFFFFVMTGPVWAFLGSGGSLYKIETLPTWLIRVATEQGKNAALYAYQFAQTEWQKQWLSQEKESLRDDMIATQVGMLAKQVQTEAIMAGLQSVTDGNALTANQGQVIENAADKDVPPGDMEALLCNTITTRQLFIKMQTFAEMVGNLVAQSVMLQNRGPNADGRGPQKTKEAFVSRCGKLEGGNIIPFANPMDGYGEGCLGVGEGKKKDLSDVIDADINFDTISGDYALEVPSVKKETVETPSGDEDVYRLEPEEENLAQSRFLAAQQQCILLAGFEIEAPYGRQMATPQGAAAAAKHAQCSTLKSTLAQACGRRIGILSRPNCEKVIDPTKDGAAGSEPGDDRFKSFCAAGRAACYAAQAAGVTIPDSMDQCKHGLSLYESGQISALLCSTAKRAITLTPTTGGHPQTIMGSDLCTQTQRKMNDWWRESQRAHMDMLKGFQELKSCWQDYEKQFLPKS